MQFLRGISSSTWPMFSSSSVLISYVVICALMAGLQLQCVAAKDIPSHKTSAEDQLQEILDNEKYFEYDEGLEDDNEEVDHLRDDGHLTKDELQDLQYAKNHYKKPSSRAQIPATINGTTIVTMGNTYIFDSHDEFSVLRYSSNYMRYFSFVRDPSIECLEIYCYYFRIERSYSCYKDRVVIYAPPTGPRKRFCGKRHGFYRKYYSDVWVVFITDDGTRKPGFSCEITPSPFPIPPTTAPLPCCQQTPTAPAVRQVVTSCADLLPGYPCQCSDVQSGGICLTCTFCETCELEFFAVHDFSQTILFIYFDFPCPNCPLDLDLYGFGYQQYVGGYIECIVPYPYITLPDYPSSATVLATFCPISFDHCPPLAGRGLHLEDGHKKEIEHLAKSCSGSKNLLLVDNTEYLPAVPDPEKYRSVTITNTDCSNGTQGGIIDLKAFTSVESIHLELCTCGDIELNSLCIQSVIIDIPDPSNCNTCIVSNQAAPNLPTVTCQ